MDVVFTYGRFNPPHLGHKMMIEKIINKAEKLNKKPLIIVSHTTGNPRNPLTVTNKLQILRRWFPDVTFLSSSKNMPLGKIAENFSKNSEDDGIGVIFRRGRNYRRNRGMRFLVLLFPTVLKS